MLKVKKIRWFTLILLSLWLGVTACAESAIAVIGGADGPTSVLVSDAAEDGDSEEGQEDENETDFLKMHSEVYSDRLSMEVELGYDGAVTYGRAIPFAVTLTNNGDDLQGKLCVNLYQNQVNYDRIEVPVELAAGAVKRVSLPVNLTMRQDVFTFEFIADGQTVCAVNAKPSETISPYGMLVGVLSHEPKNLDYLNITADNDALLRGEYWHTITLGVDTFPSDSDLMNSFGMIVVDGFNMNDLSEVQRAAFEAWLDAGGIVLVGGGAQAATDYPYFQARTGLDAGPLAETADITPAIMDYVGMTGAAIEEAFLLNAPEAAVQPLIESGEQPVIYLTDAGDGVILSATFDLGAKPITGWETVNTMWQRILLTARPELYAQRLNGVSYDNSYWQAREMIESIYVDNNASMIPVFIVILVFLLLAGIGAYFLMKKLDSRELLWGIIPVLSVIAAGVIWFLSTTTSMNGPIAVTVSHANMTDKGAEVKTYAGVACKDTSDIVLTALDGEIRVANDQSYYYDDNAEQTKRIPTEQRYRYIYGEQVSVAYPDTAPWTVNYATVEQAQNLGKVSGEMWMEADGLHAAITNETNYILRDGYLLTNLGYCSVPEILPGETAEVAIVYDQDDSSQAQDDEAIPMQVEDGKIVSASGMANGGYRLQSYDLIYKIVYPETVRDPQWASSSLSKKEQEARNMKMSLLNSVVSGDDQNMLCQYVGFNDEIGFVNIQLNGTTIERTAHQGVVSMNVEYLPVGKTGLVSYIAGLLKVMEVEADGDGQPQFSGAVSNRYDYDLNQFPFFGFIVPDIEKIDVERIVFGGQYVEGNVIFSLYNYTTGAWDAQQGIYLEISDNVADYVGPKGEIVVRGQTDSDGTSSYSYLYMPYIEVYGREKNG